MNSALPSAVTTLLDQQQGDRVLMVDDVPDNLSLLHDALDEHGYTVLAATNGEAALACARQGRPDIVLLDAMMPGMDGFEVCKRLKADPATAAIPVIFLTAKAQASEIEEGLRLGAAGYLTKPFDPLQLKDDLEAVLHGK